jgi:transcription-repair coupling factor (superfamily II helicase)
MDLSSLLPDIQRSLALDSLRTRLERGSRSTVGVIDAGKAPFLASLVNEQEGPSLVIVPKLPTAHDLADELTVWLGASRSIHLFPERDSLPYEQNSPDPTVVRQRLRALQALAQRERAVVVASAVAVAQRTLAPMPLGASDVEAGAGQQIGLQKFIGQLLDLGYRSVSLVEQPGDIAHRGGIVDVFPAINEDPARIEFIGDQIETIRRFSLETQRSTEAIARLTLGPAREVIDLPGAVGQFASMIDLANCQPQVRERFEEEFARLQQGDSIAEEQFFVPFTAKGSLLDHLPDESLLIIDEAAQVVETLQEHDQQAAEERGTLEERGELPSGMPLPHQPWEDLRRVLDRPKRQIRLSRWAVAGDDLPADPSSNVVRLPFAAAGAYGGRLRSVAEDLADARKKQRSVVVVSQQAERLGEVLAEEGVTARLLDAPMVPPGGVQLVAGSLNHGWTLDGEPSLTLITDTELFGFRKQRRRTPDESRRTRESFLADVSPGDIVVHIDHGVGRFAGLVHRATEGIAREYLDLRFAAGDRLYVPAHQVDRVSRYIGPSDRPPALNKLGSQEWSRAKERVRRAAADIAKELLDLYAARDVLPGRAYPGDTPWQQELEGSFPYIETPDQVAAMHAIKADMERPRPMDRLICGDVGYGKTELAVRAAFKAVVDGVQAAVLVPTTVLAQQHYTTFSERLAGFPVTVEMLSRFRSAGEQHDIIEKLAAGAIDIVIGTHRLFQKDVQFKDLGLVIIDEEQRFGVAHKERLKQMRKEVDVLTLTATPIPRTMHMALSGVRDLSMMETPPETRLPIKTYISESDDHVVREAILREIERGGQVFFVHNRVHDIERISSRIREIVPQASVDIAHGQQPELVLERAMIDFVEGKTDVLVCTTIIESGLDIPNVNTLIVDKADKLGLAQLYQLRGRVGRGAVRAYAYLLFDGYRALSEPAQRRLQAVFEATDLGAGFQIALRDLEIRGAGNLLGAEQSGHIGSVGFDLYVRLLADAVGRLKALREGRESPPPKAQAQAPSLDLPLTAHLPSTYVPDLNMRLALYQRMADIDDPGHVQQLRHELRDRFGEVPPAADQLLYTVHVRALASRAGVTSVQRDGDDLVLRFKPDVSPRELLKVRATNGLRVGSTQVRLRRDGSWQDSLLDLLNGLARLSSVATA